MKTLLEWLEENRSTLKDGVYRVSSLCGSVYCVGSSAAIGKAIYTKDKYQVKDGVITLLTPVTLVNKYNRVCKGVTIDVYDVLKAFEVTDPALQHLIKKALCTGLRGHKTREQDLQDILESAKRAVELNK